MFSSDVRSDGAKFLKSATFRPATFAGSTSFSEVTFGGDARVCGLEDARPSDDAQVTRDGEPFRGWPPVTGAVERP
ncbi:pentapeptide repeat-containing protein [Ornithinimicrobium pratense]|uniref:pentapeptide repeat-containing protein n=1 Tax=Ornithinimicrobium pratense TaxID=2593973 RepID=UPI003B520CC3